MTMHRWLASILCVALLVGCSSDALVPPDPSVATPGAFVATAASGGYGLFRTLKATSFPQDTLLTIKVYDVHPSTLDEARAIAQGADIPVALENTIVAQSTLAQPQVVWFRSLGPEAPQ
jgi:hypothetical protein